MLTNFIQPVAAPSASPNQQVPPFQSGGTGASSFASSLQGARAPAAATPQQEPATITGEAKSAEKKPTGNSKAPASGQETRALSLTSDAKLVSVTIVNLATMLPLPQDFAGSIVIAGLIPPSLNSRSDGSTAAVTGLESAKNSSSGKSAGRFEPDKLTADSGTVLNPTPSSAGAGRQTPVDDRATLLNGAAATVNVNISLPVSTVPSVPMSDSGAWQSAGGPSSVVNQKSALTPVSDSAVLKSALGPSSAVAEFAGTASDTHSISVIASAPDITPDAVNLTSGIANAAAEAKRSMSDAKLEAANQDLPPAHTTPNQDLMPLQAIDPMGNPTNAVAGNKQSTWDGKPQLGKGDLVPLVVTPTQNLMPSNAVNLMRDTPITAAGAAQPQSGSAGVKPAAPGSLFPASGAMFAAEISKPISLPAALAMKALDANPAADARAKETSTERVLPPQVPSNQAPPSLEGARSKPVGSSTSMANTNVQPPSPNVFLASSAGAANAASPPGGVVAAANVLVQTSTAANQDLGSRSAASPAAEPHSTTASLPTTLPLVGPVEAARMVAGVSQSEMHIGLRTQAFGGVELHTVVRDSEVGLTVGSERGDLRTLLATEVSSLQSAFRQQDLRFDNIHFLETGPGTTAGFSGGADSQSRSSGQQHSSPTGLFSTDSPPEDRTEINVSSGLQTRLNVHA